MDSGGTNESAAAAAAVVPEASPSLVAHTVGIVPVGGLQDISTPLLPGGGSSGGSAASLGPLGGRGAGGDRRRGRWAVPWVAHSPPRWAVAAAWALLVCDWAVFCV